MSPERLYGHSIRHPRRVLSVAILVTLAAAPGLLRLELRTDGSALIPHGAAGVRVDHEIRDEFHVEDDLVVVVRARNADGLFNEHTLGLLKELTTDLQARPGIGAARVTSLATERGHRVRPGSLSFRTFLDPLPRTREELERLRADVRSLELYSGTLVSDDETAGAILVGVPAGKSRIELWREVEDVVARRDASQEDVSVIGAPVAEALLGVHILDDLGVPRAVLGSRAPVRSRGPGLLPLVLLIVALVFFAAFRCVAAVALPLTEVGACLLAVFGLMGYCAVPVYLTTSILPVILTMIGVTDEVHIFSRYAQLRRREPERGPQEAVRQTLDEVARPVVKTSITTAVGFLSFAISPIAPVRSFGLFAAAGIAFCMLWSLTAIPALLVLLEPRVAGWHGGGRGAGILDVPGRLGTRRPRVVLLLVAALALVLLPAGIHRLRVQDSWIAGFPPASEFARATRSFNEGFFGTHVLLARVSDTRPAYSGEATLRSVQPLRIALPANRVDDPAALVGGAVHLDPAGAASRRGDVTDPAEHAWSSVVVSAKRSGDDVLVSPFRGDGWPVFALRPGFDERLVAEVLPQTFVQPEGLGRTDSLETFVRESRLPTVGGVLGPVEYLETTRYIVRERRRDERTIPDDPREIRRLWEDYDRIRGDGRLGEIVRSDYRAGLISIFLQEANFVDTARVLEAVRGWSREHLEPFGLTLSFGGDVAVSQALIRGIVRTQVGSLMISLVGILLVVAALSRSFHWGAYCLVPCALAVATVLSTMGWLGIPLGVATSVFAGMTLGIGVDFAIHLMECYVRAAEAGRSSSEAAVEALRLVGPAILTDGIAILLGFSILGLSRVPANAHLGAVALVTVLTCLVATFVLLPALVSAYPPGGSTPVRRARRRDRR